MQSVPPFILPNNADDANSFPLPRPLMDQERKDLDLEYLPTVDQIDFVFVCLARAIKNI